MVIAVVVVVLLLVAIGDAVLTLPRVAGPERTVEDELRAAHRVFEAAARAAEATGTARS